MKKLHMLLAVVFIVAITGCSSGDSTTSLSSAKAITAFTFPTSKGTAIDEGTHTIAVTVPYSTNVTTLVPAITHTGASISPASGVAHDFTSTATYTVTAANGSTQGYIVTVTVAAPPWKQMTDFGGTERYASVGFSIGSKGYIGTGYGGGYKNDFWEYDPSTDTWTQMANFGGSGRYNAVGFSIGSKGYIGTGFAAGYTQDFWEYDPSLNKWTQMANFGGGLRERAVGFSIGSKGYIGTGYTGSTFINDFWEYNPTTDTWTQMANFGGTVRWGAVGFSIGSYGYIGTGNIDRNGAAPCYKDFWEYDPSTGVGGTWTQKSDFGGIARHSAVGFSIGSKGYIGTGFTGSTSTKDFWEYDPSTGVGGTWTQKTDFGGIERSLAVGFSIGTKGYLGTGIGTVSQNESWEYDPSLD